MSDSQHTPGPWLVLQYHETHFPGIEAEGVPRTVVIFGYPGEDCGVRGGSPDERKANARLIAAAPELLEALRDLSAIMEWQYGGALFAKPARVKAKSAIAKATGKEADQ